MSTQFDPLVLEARFGQLAAALVSGAGVPRAAIGAVAAQAHLALRGLDARVQHEATVRLERSASRLARRLALGRGDAVAVVGIAALSHIVVQLAIEMGRAPDPLAVGVTVRNVLSGCAELSDCKVARPDAHEAPGGLFTKIALVVASARLRFP